MKFLDKLFGKSEPPTNTPQEDDEPIVIVPIPPLVTLLLHLEKEKGAPLTEAEVIEIRDKAICMTMRVSHRDQLATKRGYADISLENVWDEWQEFLVANPSTST
jgi:hypothetical protein